MRWTASEFERLDPRLFRSFLAVVRNESFSAAATEVALTQGAISQQIAKLEERLNTQLFVRAGQKVVTTPAGQLLATHARAYMEHTAHFLEQLNHEFESMRGPVAYAMPESCVHAPHFGWLLERRKEHPDLVLSIELKPSPDVLADVLASNIDFGFVTQPSEAQAIQSYPFCREHYLLLGPASGMKQPSPSSLDELLALPMIVYPGMVHGLNRWIQTHIGPDEDPITPVALKMTGHFNDLRGVLAMVEGGLGYTVLPWHVAAQHIEQQRLHVLGARDDTDPPRVADLQIWIIRLKDRRMPARVKRVIRWFLDMHTELQPVPEEFLA